jgi:hypothetical protein
MSTKQLDLHNMTHEEARLQVENFILLNSPPLSIITGDSDRMREIVTYLCDTHQISYERWDWGEIKILK